MFRGSLSTLALLVLTGLCFGEDAVFSPEQIKFFESKVRPLLAERCWKCHGEEKQSGELRLDHRTMVMTGGESGPAISLESPAESLLLEAIRYESFEMPPDGRLKDDEIATLATWIEMGAPWPGDDVVAMQRPQKEKISDEDREFWSFRPLHMPDVPQLEGDTWSRRDIDRFVLRKLRENELSPAEEADRRTLIRRLYFDLIGLPPSPEEVDAFLADQSPDAYEKLVDRLLDSPRFGEHWARFWLDLVRYADSDGFRKDDFRPDAWRYRDYVIQAFNDDKPFDQFVREQIAADEMYPNDPQKHVATGFLRHGMYEYNQRDAQTQWQDMLNDITDTTGDVFLGVGMGCARCHDHKFDPILQADYFRLQAFFVNISLQDETAAASAADREAYATKLGDWEQQTAELRAKLAEMETPYLDELREAMVDKFPFEVQEIYRKPNAEKTAYDWQVVYLVDLQAAAELAKLPGKFRGEEKKTWTALKEELAKFDKLKPAPLPASRTIRDYDLSPPPVFIPGKERLGEVEPGFLTIFAPEPVAPEILPDLPASSGRRTVLANWLTRPDHPLTTRVIVNRIWQEHFGQGIVPTPNDFGHLGEAPSHPELLDWLATSFVSNDWSLKWLHREIVLSAAYRQQAVVENAQAGLIDPANRLMWRAPLRRLSAEQIRDAMLVAGGEIEHRLGGSPDDAAKSKRRSIYCKVMRNKPDDMLSAFDLPDRMRSTGDRNTTTTPNQALLLINSQQAMARGTALARRVQQDVPETFSSQIDRAFQIAFGRPADPQELELLSTFADSLATTIKPAMIDVATVPGTDVSGVPIDDAKHPALELADRTDLPTADFTLEAVVNLHSRYPDTKVRTIMSQWDGETSHSGWSLGVTSTKSKYTPGNFVLQLIGEDEKGILTYEVIASGLILEVDHPYSVSVSVTAQNTSGTGVLFRVVDLATQEEQTSFQSHRVVQKFHPELPLIIGGRAGSDEFKWDGHLGSIRLTLAALAAEELKTELPARQQAPQAVWEFKEPSPTQIDSVQQWALFPYDNNKTPSALVDACHVLLNSNEFLYVE